MRDLLAIIAFLTRQAGPRIADKVERRLFEACADLDAYPALGHLRTDLTARPVLFYPVFRYLIVFRREREDTVVLAILHGARNLEDLLKSRIL